MRANHTLDPRRMNNSLNYGQAWVIEAALRSSLPIHGLDRPPHIIDEWLRRGSHGLDFRGLSKEIWGMIEGGLCKVCTIEEVEVHDRQSLECGLREERELWLEITPQGGELWESYANPDWSRFYAVPISDDATNFSIMATNLPRIEEIVSHLPALTGFCADKRIACYDCAPLHALYWKTLPFGLNCKFKVRELPYKEDVEIEYSDYVALRSWCTSIVGADIV